MAKAAKKDTSKSTKVVEKKKNPKPDFTPKHPVVKTKGVVVAEKPPIFYWGEGTFVVQEEGASSTWNESSRQLALDAAQDFLLTYLPAARGPIFAFAEKVSLSNTWKEISDEEYRFFGGILTKGSHMKRQRFWKFVSYIGKGRIPPDLTLRIQHDPYTFSGAGRADAMEYLIDEIKKTAIKMLGDGTSADVGMNPETLLRWHCTVADWKPLYEWRVESQVAPHDYDKTNDKGYKTLADWSTHPYRVN
jgi:hypothetical protein